MICLQETVALFRNFIHVFLAEGRFRGFNCDQHQFHSTSVGNFFMHQTIRRLDAIPVANFLGHDFWAVSSVSNGSNSALRCRHFAPSHFGQVLLGKVSGTFWAEFFGAPFGRFEVAWSKTNKPETQRATNEPQNDDWPKSIGLPE